MLELTISQKKSLGCNSKWQMLAVTHRALLAHFLGALETFSPLQQIRYLSQKEQSLVTVLTAYATSADKLVALFQ